jgi:uncharacterized membrane protein
MSYFRHVRDYAYLIIGIIAVFVFAILGILVSLPGYELSQLLIVLVFLGVTVTIAEQQSRYQKANDKRLEFLEASLVAPNQEPLHLESVPNGDTAEETQTLRDSEE